MTFGAARSTRSQLSIRSCLRRYSSNSSARRASVVLLRAACLLMMLSAPARAS